MDTRSSLSFRHDPEEYYPEDDETRCPRCASKRYEYQESKFMNELGETEWRLYRCNDCGYEEEGL